MKRLGISIDPDKLDPTVAQVAAFEAGKVDPEFKTQFARVLKLLDPDEIEDVAEGFSDDFFIQNPEIKQLFIKGMAR